MPEGKMLRSMLGLGFTALLVSPLLPLLLPQSRPVRTVYVVAARDSRLLTMCPNAGEVKMANGRTWKSDNNVIVMPHPAYLALRFLEGSRSVPVSLPLPASLPSGGQSAGRPASDTVVLDRVARDPEIESRIEREFSGQKEYQLVYSLEKADLVFLVEGIYSPMEIWRNNTRRGAMTYLFGDRKSTFLQAALAIAVPAGAYARNPADMTALLPARIWEGSVICQQSRDEEVPRPAPAAELVRQFLNKAKRPPSHFPLCAASDPPSLVPGGGPELPAGIPAARVRGPARPVVPEQMAAGESATIKVATELVTVPVIATDSDGQPVTHLSEANFRISEENVEQKIERFYTSGDPFDVALVLDASSSMSMNAQDLQRAALLFVEAMRPEERTLIASFNERVFLHSEFSSDRTRLRPAILGIGRGDGTRLHDAIHLLLADRFNAPGRKAIVILTDGVDTRSLLSDADHSLSALQASQVLAYAVQYDTREGRNQLSLVEKAEQAGQDRSGFTPLAIPEELKDRRGIYERGIRYLEDLTASSGGWLYRDQTLESLKSTFAKIAWELGRQYTLCYYSSNPNPKAEFRRIHVTVNLPGVTIRSRTGYRVTAVVK